VLRVACAQLAPRVGDAEGNRRLARDAIRRAIDGGARLVVLPELVTSGYVFASADEARSLAEAADGPALAEWAAEAAHGDAVVVGGFAELADDGTLFNSAAIVDADGIVAAYRKTHLWDREKLVFEPGCDAPRVVETRVGKIGLAVCYDLYFPEVARGLALAGAEIVVVPANLPKEADPPPGERPIEITIAMAQAALNRVYIAQCDRAGEERGVEWVGASAIADPDGWLAAGPVEGYGPGLVFAECDLARTHDKAWSERNDCLADRRPELYSLGDPVAL
jgi:predicted amidohydrolase